MTIIGKSSSRAVLFFTLLLLGGACGDDVGNEPPEPDPVDPNLWVDADGNVRGPLVDVRLAEAVQVLEIERTLTRVLSAEGFLGDGSAVDLGDQVTWSTSEDEPTILRLGEPTADGVEVEALAEGTVTVYAEFGTLRGEQTVSVIPPALVELAISAPGDLRLRDILPLAATARYRDGSEVDVTSEASWASSDPTSISVMNDEGRKGLAFAQRRAPSTITAQFEDMSAELELEVACTLIPGNTLAPGISVPDASWPAAIWYRPDGTREVRSLSMENLMCDPAFDRYKAFVISLNAGWCGPCHQWMRLAGEGADLLEAAGVLVLFVVFEDEMGRVSNTDYAELLVNTHMVADPRSIRVGDGDTVWSGGGLRRFTGGSVPAIFTIDRQEMRVVARERSTTQIVTDIVERANALPPGGAVEPPLVTNCPDGADEWSEPNDAPAIAPFLDVGAHSGGICNLEHDYYRVRLEGDWEVTLSFDLSQADLDIYVLAIEPGEDGVRPVLDAATSGPRSPERVAGSGPALLLVRPKYESDTAPYTLELTAL